MQDLQPDSGERHIELDLESRRGQHHAADARRVVVRPCGHQDGADALAHHPDVLDGDPAAGGDVVHKRVDISN